MTNEKTPLPYLLLHTLKSLLKIFKVDTCTRVVRAALASVTISLLCAARACTLSSTVSRMTNLDVIMCACQFICYNLPVITRQCQL